MAATIGILVAIGLVLGILIHIVNIVVPQKIKGLEKIEKITSLMPGANCGACGNPSCFAYAKILSEDSSYLSKNPCGQVLNNEENLAQLEDILDISINTKEMSKKAIIHCNGNSEAIYDYSGVNTCKGAAQLLRGFKKCPHACLGFGDCAQVCPVNCITIDPEKRIAVIDKAACIACGLCPAECPQNLIELVPNQTKVVLLCNYQTLRDLPGREKCDSGCIHCRRCLKACEFDAITFNAERGIPVFDSIKCTRCGKCIEDCPPHCLAFFSVVKKAPEPVTA
jgi:Na+-translocating ferredoxin:NAD+ oxidoreductase subunit B